MKFKTKSEMLDYLRNRVKQSKIFPQISFIVEEWRNNRDSILNKTKEFFKSNRIIIRSSSLQEDTSEESQAGHFKSILDIDPSDTATLIGSVEKVISSFGNPDPKDQVFIQEYLRNPSISGVVFTRDIVTLAPYYVVNFDETTLRTDTVTSGASDKLKTLVKYRDYPSKDSRFKNLFKAVEEVMQILKSDSLDIEFAIGKDKKTYIFQVRPIVTKKKEYLTDDSEIKEYLRRAYKKIKKLSSPHILLYGDTTLFGVMPDWNPAEMIGTKPKRLAESLYKELITDRVWAYQRYNYGYSNLRSFPLIKTFLGTPFVDVRVDFNSFIPKALSEGTSRKLVGYYLKKLSEKPKLHDKVEFEIVFSCYYFSLERDIAALKDYGFSQKEIAEIKKCLLDLTNKTFFQDGLHNKDMEKIEELKKRYEIVVNSDMHKIDRIYWLIEDCKRYGTLPFAGIARSAFVATQMLNSLVDIGVISRNEHKRFMNGISTVAKNMGMDFYSSQTGKMPKSEFLKKYGHLRPGTYDITSKRYDENFENYFSIKKINEPALQEKFDFSKIQLRKIDGLIASHGLKTSASGLVGFITKSIEGREYAKYIFTKSLSKTLQLIEKLGKEHKISREELSYVNIQTILGFYSSLDHRSLHEILTTDISINKKYYDQMKPIKFPNLISKPDDVYEFYLDEDEPNFVTFKKISAEVLLERDINNNLKGKILLLESADPGYDWIFSHDIAGLVTKYGGANSHMTIRAAELDIPAVVGCGKVNFDKWSKAERMEIDCSNRQVRTMEHLKC